MTPQQFFSRVLLPVVGLASLARAGWTEHWYKGLANNYYGNNGWDEVALANRFADFRLERVVDHIDYDRPVMANDPELTEAMGNMDYISAKWFGVIQFAQDTTLRWQLWHDDGFHFRIDGKDVFDPKARPGWDPHSPKSTTSDEITYLGGVEYIADLSWFELRGQQVMRVLVSYDNGDTYAPFNTVSPLPDVPFIVYGGTRYGVLDLHDEFHPLSGEHGGQNGAFPLPTGWDFVAPPTDPADPVWSLLFNFDFDTTCIVFASDEGGSLESEAFQTRACPENADYQPVSCGTGVLEESGGEYTITAGSSFSRVLISSPAWGHEADDANTEEPEDTVAFNGVSYAVMPDGLSEIPLGWEVVVPEEVDGCASLPADAQIALAAHNFGTTCVILSDGSAWSTTPDGGPCIKSTAEGGRRRMRAARSERQRLVKHASEVAGNRRRLAPSQAQGNANANANANSGNNGNSGNGNSNSRISSVTIQASGLLTITLDEPALSVRVTKLDGLGATSVTSGAADGVAFFQSSVSCADSQTGASAEWHTTTCDADGTTVFTGVVDQFNVPNNCKTDGLAISVVYCDGGVEEDRDVTKLDSCDPQVTEEPAVPNCPAYNGVTEPVLDAITMYGNWVAPNFARANPDSRVLIRKASSSNRQYWGCYKDDSNRLLRALHKNQKSLMTPQYCIDYCKENGYDLAGVQYKFECRCDSAANVEERLASQSSRYYQTPDSDCNSKCAGDGSLACGGGWRNSIYSTSTDSWESQVSAFTNVITLGTNQYASLDNAATSTSGEPAGQTKPMSIPEGWTLAPISYREGANAFDYEGPNGFMFSAQYVLWDDPEMMFSLTSSNGGIYVMPKGDNTRILVHRQVPPVDYSQTCGRCIAWGDPHYITLDGAKYNSHLEEEVVFLAANPSDDVNAPPFSIHNRHEKIPGMSVATNAEVAVKFGIVVLIVKVSDTPRELPTISVNGGEHYQPAKDAAENYDAGDGSKVWVTRKGTSDAGTRSERFRYEILLPNFVKVTVRAGYWKRNLMDVITDIPEYYRGKTIGLCGSCDNDASNDDVTCDGTDGLGWGKKALSFAVPGNEALISRTYADAAAFDHTYDCQGLPPPEEEPEEYEDPCEDVDPVLVAQFAEACGLVENPDDVNAQNCLIDCCATGDTGPIDGADDVDQDQGDTHQEEEVTCEEGIVTHQTSLNGRDFGVLRAVSDDADGCQSKYLSIPDGWSVANVRDVDNRAVLACQDFDTTCVNFQSANAFRGLEPGTAQPCGIGVAKDGADGQCLIPRQCSRILLVRTIESMIENSDFSEGTDDSVTGWDNFDVDQATYIRHTAPQAAVLVPHEMEVCLSADNTRGGLFQRVLDVPSGNRDFDIVARARATDFTPNADFELDDFAAYADLYYTNADGVERTQFGQYASFSYTNDNTNKFDQQWMERRIRVKTPTSASWKGFTLSRMTIFLIVRNGLGCVRFGNLRVELPTTNMIENPHFDPLLNSYNSGNAGADTDQFLNWYGDTHSFGPAGRYENQDISNPLQQVNTNSICINAPNEAVGTTGNAYLGFDLKQDQREWSALVFGCDSIPNNPGGETITASSLWSVYVDARLSDGSFKYGLTAQFSGSKTDGVDDWVSATKVVQMEAGIDTLGYNLVYRHEGFACFDNCFLVPVCCDAVDESDNEWSDDNAYPAALEEQELQLGEIETLNTFTSDGVNYSVCECPTTEATGAPANRRLEQQTLLEDNIPCGPEPGENSGCEPSILSDDSGEDCGSLYCLDEPVLTREGSTYSFAVRLYHNKNCGLDKCPALSHVVFGLPDDTVVQQCAGSVETFQKAAPDPTAGNFVGTKSDLTNEYEETYVDFCFKFDSDEELCEGDIAYAAKGGTVYAVGQTRGWASGACDGSPSDPSPTPTVPSGNSVDKYDHIYWVEEGECTDKENAAMDIAITIDEANEPALRIHTTESYFSLSQDKVVGGRTIPRDGVILFQAGSKYVAVDATEVVDPLVWVWETIGLASSDIETVTALGEDNADADASAEFPSATTLTVIVEGTTYNLLNIGGSGGRVGNHGTFGQVEVGGSVVSCWRELTNNTLILANSGAAISENGVRTDQACHLNYYASDGEHVSYAYNAASNDVTRLVDELDTCFTVFGDGQGGKGGSGHGDPHLSTFDGTAFDCQGRGEYVLFQEPTIDLEVQIRNIPAGVASVIGAVAIQVGSGETAARVQVTRGFDGALPTVLNKGRETNLNNSEISLSSNCRFAMSGSLSGDGEGGFVQYTLTCTDDNGREYVVHIGVIPTVYGTQFLSVSSDLPASSKGITSGLLGNSDDDPSNDFDMLGVSYDPNNHEDMELGYCNWWKVDGDPSGILSVFYYENGEGVETHSETNYVAPTMDDFAEDDIIAAQDACAIVGNMVGDAFIGDCVMDVLFLNDDALISSTTAAYTTAATPVSTDSAVSGANDVFADNTVTNTPVSPVDGTFSLGPSSQTAPMIVSLVMALLVAALL